MTSLRPCTCGRPHTIPDTELLLHPEALRLFPGRLRFLLGRPPQTAAGGSLGPGLVLLSDENTYAAAGEALERALTEEGFQVTPIVLSPAARGAKLAADERSLGRLVLGAPERARVLVSCGAGTLTDLVRYAGHRLGLPAACFATAPSMDGYMSSVAPLIYEGRKITYPASPLLLVGADPSVLAGAPLALKASGFADLLGKYTSRLDWELAAEVKGEKVCASAEGLIFDQLRLVLVQTGTQEFLNSQDPYDQNMCSLLFHALAASGTAIAVAGDSRPASGSEHHISHYLEMKALAGEAPVHFHGETVALGLRISAFLYRDFFLNDKFRGIRSGYVPSGFAGRVAETLPSTEDLDRLLRTGRVRCDPGDMGYSPELLRETVLNAKSVRSRYTILSFLHEAGLLEAAAGRIIEKLYS